MTTKVSKMNPPKLRYTTIKNNVYYLNFRIPLYKNIRMSLYTDSRKTASVIVAGVTPLIVEIKKVGKSMYYVGIDPLISHQVAINTLVKVLTIKIKEFANTLMLPTSHMATFTKEDYNFLLDDIDREEIAKDTEATLEDIEASINERYNQDHLNCIEFLSSPERSMITIKAESFLSKFICKNDPFYNNALRSVEYVFHQANKINSDIENYEYEQAETALKSLQNYSDKLNGIESEPEKATPHQIEITPEPKKPITPLFSKCITDYIKANTGNKGKKWSDNTLDKNNRELGILLEAIGDIPVGVIDSHLLDDTFEDAIKGLPMGNKKPFNGMNYKQLVETARNNDIEDPEDVVAPKTSSEYKKTLQGLFKYCRQQRYIITSPTNGMMCKLHKNVERGMFTNTEVKAMYNFCMKQSEPHKKWCVPLMIYTGCRNNEIAQLTVSDIKECPETGIAYIHINANDGKHVKSKAGLRQVPIHKDLLSNFLEYVKTCDNELFPNTTSKTLTRYYQVLKNNCSLPITDEKGNRLALYSTRHRYITTLINTTGNERLVQEIVGHKGKKTVTGGYFKGFELSVKHEAVELFKF